MQLGFLTSGTVEDVRFARQEGFDCVELALFGDTPLFRDHHAFQHALNDEGINLAAVSLFGKNHQDTDASIRKANAELWEQTADLAAELGTDLFIAGAGRIPDIPDEAQWEEVAERLQSAIEGVQRRGLEFAFYNCHWENVIDRPAAWACALPKLPGIGIKFDPSHPVYDHRDWTAELVEAGPHLMHTHAKDVLRVGDTMISDPNPGLGQIAWGPFFGILYHVGYDGAVCIEPHSALYTGENRHRFLALSGRYLRQFMLPDV
jgi:sugar phosphate isomerase/epimerase